MTATAQERAELAQLAAIEVESIGAALQLHFQRCEVEHTFVIGLGIRLEALASVVLSALDDELASIDEASDKLAGPAAVRARRDAAR